MSNCFKATGNNHCYLLVIHNNLYCGQPDNKTGDTLLK